MKAGVAGILYVTWGVPPSTIGRIQLGVKDLPLP